MSDTNREQQLQEILVAYLEAVEAGQVSNRDEWLTQHPELANDLNEFLAGQEKMEQVAKPLKQVANVPASPQEAPTLGPENAVPTDIGTKIRYFGDYELLDEIARGGMGVVFKAQQVKLNRTVAVKMILAGELANDTDVERFYTEARAAANLQHPNIVAIHEVGEHHGQHYFSMDFVEGESLAHKIARGPLPAREAADLMKKVAGAVSFAHVEGVIHRDLKPANILLDAGGEPHVTDFGLAKRMASSGRESGEGEGETASVPRESLTATGQVLGTPSYMPPEQAAGSSKEIGPRSDDYSLGAVLYCSLTGRPPFQAASPLDTLLQVLDREPVSPRILNSTVPRDLETICLKCLEKDPRRRYASAQELLDELQRFLDGKPIKARRVSAVGRGWRWCRRNPAVAALTASLFLTLVTGTIVASWLAMQAQREADRAAQQERKTRRYLYSAHMNLADQAWQKGNVLRVLELLDQHRPKAGREDLRGFEWHYLQGLCHRQRKTIKLYRKDGSDLLYYPAVSPDGRYIVSGVAHWARRNNQGYQTWEVPLWDAATGNVVKTFKQPNADVQKLVFSPDGKLLVWHSKVEHIIKNSRATPRQVPKIMIWNVETGKLQATIALPDAHFGELAISHNGKMLALVHDWNIDGKNFSGTKIWDIPEGENARVGQEKHFLKRNDSHIFRSLAFTADDRFLLWRRTQQDHLTLTDLSMPDNHSALKLDNPLVTFTAYSPDGKYLATRTVKGTWNNLTKHQVNLHDAKTGKTLFTIPGPPSRVIRFSRDSRLLGISRGNFLEIWDVVLKKQMNIVRGHTGQIWDFGFGAGGKSIVTLARNKLVGGFSPYEARIWDIETQFGPVSFSAGDRQVKSMAVSPDGHLLATVAEYRPVKLWDLTSGAIATELGELTSEKPKGFRPEHVRFSPDGKMLAVAGQGLDAKGRRDEVVQLWKLSRSAAGVKTTLQTTWFTPLSGHAPFTSFSFDGKKLVYAQSEVEVLKVGGRRYKNETLRLRELSSGKTQQIPADRKNWFAYKAGLRGIENLHHFNYAVFSPGGKRLFTVHADGIVVWEAATSKVQAVLKSPNALLYSEPPIALSPDGETLASIHAGNAVRIWDVSEDKLRQILNVIKQRAAGVRGGTRNSPDEPAAKPTCVLRGHGAEVTSMAFSPDGKSFASASKDRTIKLWDIKIGEERLTLEGHDTPITALAFTPDGNALLSGDSGGNVKLWRAGK